MLVLVTNIGYMSEQFMKNRCRNGLPQTVEKRISLMPADFLETRAQSINRVIESPPYPRGIPVAKKGGWSSEF